MISRLRVDAPRLLEHEQAVWDYLAGQTDYIALCHWNANIDNAWFWRDADGVLCCGLLDWGCVGQMNVAMALWGALSGAELDLWDHHLDELLNVFIDEIRRCGGPELSVDELSCQLMLYVGIMTVAWLLDVPALIRSRFGDAAARDDQRTPADQERRERPGTSADAEQRAASLGHKAIRHSAGYCPSAMRGWWSVPAARRR